MTTEITSPTTQSMMALPDLTTATAVGFNLSSSYWSPQEKGETRRLYFIEIKIVNHSNDDTGEVKELPTAVFVDPITKEVIHQSSARLVGILQRERAAFMTPFQITYRGKEKNSTNQFSSDTWEVYYLNDGQKAK